MLVLKVIAMKTAFLLLAFICLACASLAQRTRFSIGPEYSLATFKEFPSNGIGGSIAVEFRSKKKISANIETGYNYFKGTVVNSFKHDTTHGFGFIPVLAGIKFSAGNKFYGTMRAGLIFGNSLTAYALSPALGVMLPSRHTPKVDIGVRLIGVPGVPAILENTFLESGGFSYLNFRAAIVL